MKFDGDPRLLAAAIQSFAPLMVQQRILAAHWVAALLYQQSEKTVKPKRHHLKLVPPPDLGKIG